VGTHEGKRWRARPTTRCALASLRDGLVRARSRASVAAGAGRLGNQAPAYFDGS
jgi:hypothetical protein